MGEGTHGDVTASGVHVPGWYQSADPSADDNMSAGKIWMDHEGLAEGYPIVKVRNPDNNGYAYTRRPVVEYAGTPDNCASIDSEIGITAALAGGGFDFYWHNTSTGVVYLIAALDDAWHYVALTECSAGSGS